MDASAKFELIRTFFEEEVSKRKLSENGYVKTTSIGHFHPSRITRINRGLEILIAEGIIDASTWFLDAGGGDGRIVILTAGKYNIPSIYVEYDEELISLAKANIHNSKISAVLNGIPLIIAEGDFTDDETYLKVG